MTHANNQIQINRGRITLYQRDDVADGIYHCRFKIKGLAGYHRRSTGETDVELAKESAIKLLADAEVRHQNNLPIKRQTFAQVADSYLKDAASRWDAERKSKGRYDIITGTLRRYLIPYWGKFDITRVQKADLITYRKWRREYWITGPGKDRKDITRKVVPSSRTLKQEWTVFRAVLQHGIDLGLISPNTMLMLKHEPSKGNRRPAFTEEELGKLEAHMDGWIEKAFHPRVKRDRELLRDYVMILAYSGIRTGEARNLRWRDISIFELENESWPLLRVDGKTGERNAIGQQVVQKYLDRMRQRGYRTEPDDLLFTHLDGKPIKVFTGFTPLLKDAGLLFDSKQKKRTLYSLRHTYASIRLENDSKIYWLCQNMGTSVAMIEQHYGQSSTLKSIKTNTATRTKTTPSLSTQ